MRVKTRPISVLLREFRRALAESAFPPAVRRKSADALESRIAKFCREHQDRRGVQADAGKRVRKVLRGMTLAVGHAETHENSEVRSAAKELVRSVQHLPFEGIEGRLRAFNVLLKAAGHSLKERRKLQSRVRYTIGTEKDDLAAVEQTSSDQLQSTGRELELCVAHKRGSYGRPYHDALRQSLDGDGGSRFYRLENCSSGEAVALMEVDAETDCVVAVEAAGNADFKLPSKAAGLDILRKLDVTADDVETFSAVGAFAAFLSGEPRPSWIAVGDHAYRCWCFPDRREVVLKRKAGPWSLFEWRTPRRRKPVRTRRSNRTRGLVGLNGWHAVSGHVGSLDVGNLLDLILHSPEVCAALRSAVHPNA